PQNPPPKPNPPNPPPPSHPAQIFSRKPSCLILQKCHPITTLNPISRRPFPASIILILPKCFYEKCGGRAGVAAFVMITEVLPVNEESLTRAAQMLRAGDVVAFPTET